VASSRARQRKLARAKLDRQMARRAEGTRRRRRIQAGVGAVLVLALIGVGTTWALGGFDSEPKNPEAADICAWTDQPASSNSNLKDVGKPATKDLPTAGTRAVTITTDKGGPITVSLDLASAPCAGASFAYLAGKSFFDNTLCHEISVDGALRCGDPSSTGLGGPTYTFYNENVPPAPTATPAPGDPPLYPKGTVALVGNPPGSNGSQFLLFFKDYNPAEPAYPIIGSVTGGLDVLTTIGATPTVDNGSGAKVKPEKDITIQALTVADVVAAAPTTATPTTPAPTEATASTTASPSPTASGQS
jgi:peptidyl-prolyl cis-trans isomerase B (cyclophilin B)